MSNMSKRASLIYGARADIVSVGYFDGDELRGWSMDGRGRGVGGFTHDSAMNVTHFGGWPIAELRQIVADYPRGAFVSGTSGEPNQETE